MLDRFRFPILNEEMRARENGTKAPGEVKVTKGHFPTPIEAIAEGWDIPRMMKDCRRMTKDDLTGDVLLKLHEYKLSAHKIGELYNFHYTNVAKRIREMKAGSEEKETVMYKPEPIPAFLCELCGKPHKDKAGAQRCIDGHALPKEITNVVGYDDAENTNTPREIQVRLTDGREVVFRFERLVEAG